VELHGFLSYLVKTAASGREYTIFGYKGKQVRDQIHSADAVQAFEKYIADPRPGEVYNLGGGRENSVSVLEALGRVGALLGRSCSYSYNEESRAGDHVCYISDIRKLRQHYPSWTLTYSLDAIFQEMVETELRRQSTIERVRG